MVATNHPGWVPPISAAEYCVTVIVLDATAKPL